VTSRATSRIMNALQTRPLSLLDALRGLMISSGYTCTPRWLTPNTEIGPGRTVDHHLRCCLGLIMSRMPSSTSWRDSSRPFSSSGAESSAWREPSHPHSVPFAVRMGVLFPL